MHYVVYFIESVRNRGHHYIGVTSDMKRRINDHNQGLNKSTAQLRPWTLIYAELYLNKQDAYGRERFLKSGSGWKFLKKQLTNYLKPKS